MWIDPSSIWNKEKEDTKMKDRRIYYRKKDKSIVIEGKQDGKNILIWTLPDPEKLISIIESKASNFPSDKLQNILEKVKRLDIKSDKPIKTNQKVRLLNIVRTPKIDAETNKITNEQRRQLWELTKE